MQQLVHFLSFESAFLFTNKLVLQPSSYSIFNSQSMYNYYQSWYSMDINFLKNKV